MKILTSASKMVFLAITGTVCLAYLFEIYKGVITLDSKDFFALALMVFTFYFANKGETGGTTTGAVVSANTTSTVVTEPVPPMAGK